MEYLYPLVAVHIDGYTKLLYTKDAVSNFIKKYGRFYDQHIYWYQGYNTVNGHLVEAIKRTHDWIVRDDRGRIVKYDDFTYKHNYDHYNKRQAKIRAAAEKGLPIPGTGSYRKCWKMNHTAKKNSGSGHRNRNRALAIYEAKEYGVKNDVGGRVIPWENC